ncbi:MAG TPA: hypothetical protein VFB28_06000 [Terriglobales bacterium]|jgi:hypothetical protein|nr:hypothetical protein [Terriglobales bacterium]
MEDNKNPGNSQNIDQQRDRNEQQRREPGKDQGENKQAPGQNQNEPERKRA